jgi:cytochrome o ubiquinol oxidase subunit 2
MATHLLDPFRPIGRTAPGQAVTHNTKSLKVDVVALDWKWLFIYPEQGIAAVNQLVIPTGAPISFRLTSATVMNSFFVPQLGSQIYTMGGMTTHLNLLANEPGEYPGFSANFSGHGFSDMRFMVKAVPSGDFDAWIAQVRGTGSALDDASFADLAKPGSAAPTTYRAVAPNLFERIVRRTATGGAGLEPPALRKGH